MNNENNKIGILSNLINQIDNFASKEDVVKIVTNAIKVFTETKNLTDKEIKEIKNSILDIIKTTNKDTTELKKIVENSINDLSKTSKKELKKEIELLKKQISSIEVTRIVENKINIDTPAIIDEAVKKAQKIIKFDTIEIRDSLEKLQNDERLDKSAIKGLEEIEKLAREKAKGGNKYYGGGSLSTDPLVAETLQINKRFYNNDIVTITGSTPSVLTGNQFRTNNTEITQISNFTNGKTGQIIWVEAGDINTVVEHGDNLNLQGGVNYGMQLNDTIAFIFNGTKWLETGRGGTGGGGTPGGGNTMVQFNDNGLFNGDAGLVYNKTTDTLTMGNAKIGILAGILKGTTGNVGVATAGTDYVTPNSSITGATKTKVTYDVKGLVTSGTDATQDDIIDGTTYKQYSQTEKTKLAGIETGSDNTTASNVGSAGGSGIYKQKTGSNLEFKKLLAVTDSGITINPVEDDIQIGLNQSSISHLALQNIGTNAHSTIDGHLASTTNPHSVTKTQVGLGNCDNTSDVNKPISSATQTALDTKQNTSEKDQTSGYAGLDTSGKINPNQLPALAISDTFVVTSEVAMLALTAERGDIAIRTDLNKSFILQAEPASTLANWKELLTPTDSVASVFGRTGVVTAQNNDYTWEQIDKTVSDIANITTKSHTSLTDIGTNTHSSIDTHIADTEDPHSSILTQTVAIKTPKIYPSTDSTTAVQILKADGTTSILNVDTTNQRIGIGVTAPTANFHLKAGTATAGTAPIKFNSGTLLTAPEAGVIEFDGTNFYLTI